MRGRRKLALVINEKRPSGMLIRNSFESAIKNHAGVTGLVYAGIPTTVDAGEKLAGTLLQEHPEIDSIICANDLIAIGLLNILKERGVQVPQQIALMGENNSSYCEICRPRLTSLDTMISMLVAELSPLTERLCCGTHFVGCAGGA